MKKILTILIIALMGMATYEASAGNRVEISKKELTLWVIDEVGDTVFTAPIAAGMNLGTKKKRGDHKTPEGTFAIGSIEDSSGWTFDFHDGKGKTKGAYGPWFMRLKVPGFTTIGIHGTCKPETIGTRSSYGCIRMRNEDIETLRSLVKVGTKVHIQKD